MFRRFRNYPQIGGKRGGIPADCVEVEYIEGNNNSATSSETVKYWIDTGVVAGLGYKWEIGIQFLGFGSSAGCYGRSGDRFAIGRGSYNWNDWYFGLGSINTRTGYGNVLDSKYHDFVLDAKSGLWSVDSKTGSLPSGTWYGYGGTLYLFARHGKNATLDYVVQDNNWSRLYYSRLYKDGNLIQNLVPVRRTTDGLGYMCDTLTGKLYGNAGTGAFIIGPDK